MLSLLTIPRRTVLETRPRRAEEPEEAYGIIIRPGPIAQPARRDEARPRLLSRVAEDRMTS
jgi:hypothetical protein